MAQYGGYNTQGGYGQSNRYDQPGGNAYAQQGGNPYAQEAPSHGGYGSYGGGSYGGQQPQQPQQARSDDRYGQGQNNGYVSGNDVEMGAINPKELEAREAKKILEEVSVIKNEIGEYEQKFVRLAQLQKESIDNPDAARHVDAFNNQTMALYTNLVERMRKIKQKKASGNPICASQVGVTEKLLKGAIQKYQTTDYEYRSLLQESLARQYKIVNPDASASEVQEAIQDPRTQVFAQALNQSQRRGASQSALTAVKGRHAAVQDIEKQMVQLAQLFNQMGEMVQEQQAPVENTEHSAEQTQENVQGGNVQLDSAIEKARSRNRKKWWCLLICLIILAIAIIVALVVVKVVNGHL